MSDSSKYEQTNDKIIKATIDSLIDIATIQLANEMFDKIDASISDDSIHFSEEHTKKMDKLFYEQEIHIKRRKINKHILLVAIITMITTLALSFPVDALRLKFNNYFVNIQKHGTEFRTDDIIYDEEYYVADDDKPNLKYKAKLNYIPDNFVLDNESGTSISYILQYSNDNDYFSVRKSIIPDAHGVDTENAETKYVDINGKEAFLSSKPDFNIIFWTDNDILYEIEGTINSETIINIAKNLE